MIYVKWILRKGFGKLWKSFCKSQEKLLSKQKWFILNGFHWKAFGGYQKAFKEQKTFIINIFDENIFGY